MDRLGRFEGGFRLPHLIEPEQRLAAQQQRNEAMPGAQVVSGVVETPERLFRVALPQRQMGQPKPEFRKVARAFVHQVPVALLGLVQEPLVVDAPADELGEPRQVDADGRRVRDTRPGGTA